MTSLSEQERQRRGNPTRVDISYRVLKGTPVKRIPFRAGVMADLTGHRQDLPPLYEREFISIDRRSFDDVMGRMKPALDINVRDTMSKDADDDATFRVELEFKKFEDFHPAQLIHQIPRLKALYEKRQKLLAAKVNLSDPAVADLASEALRSIHKPQD